MRHPYLQSLGVTIVAFYGRWGNEPRVNRVRSIVRSHSCCFHGQLRPCTILVDENRQSGPRSTNSYGENRFAQTSRCPSPYRLSSVWIPVCLFDCSSSLFLRIDLGHWFAEGICT